MVSKHGKVPINARVDIDYSGKEPKIKFGYPPKKKDLENEAIKQNAFVGPFPIILFFVLLLTPLAAIYLATYSYGDYPQSCNTTMDNWTSNITITINNFTTHTYHNYIFGMNLTCDTGNYTLKYRTDKHFVDFVDFQQPGFYIPDNNTPKENLILFAALLLDIYFLWIMICMLYGKWKVKQDWYIKTNPERNAKRFAGPGKWKKWNRYKPNDVFEKTIVIPQFNNVILEYETEGDFSKYLDKIRIREYRDYKYKQRRNGKIIKKLKIDNYKWYAVFTFKKKPKTGWLEVTYK